MVGALSREGSIAALEEVAYFGCFKVTCTEDRGSAGVEQAPAISDDIGRQRGGPSQAHTGCLNVTGRYCPIVFRSVTVEPQTPVRCGSQVAGRRLALQGATADAMRLRRRVGAFQVISHADASRHGAGPDFGRAEIGRAAALRS